MPTRWPERLFSSHSTETREKLEELAEEQNVSMSNVIREAVEFYLRYVEDPEKFMRGLGHTIEELEVSDLTEVQEQLNDTVSEMAEVTDVPDMEVEVEEEAEPEPEPEKPRRRRHHRGTAG